MKNFFIAFLVFLIYSIFGMWYYACIIKETCGDLNANAMEQEIQEKTLPAREEDNNTKKITNLESNPFEFKDESGNVLFNFPDNLSIKLNEQSIHFPDGSDGFSESVFKFLNSNQQKELLIIGLYNANETSNNGALGLSRAQSVKDLLVSYGLNADRISLKTKLKEFSFDNNGQYKGGVLFDFMDISDDKLKTIESGIINKTLYSGFGSKEFQADNTLQAYALELKNYLEKYPNTTAQIIGHTDSVGDDEANDWYGMERAKNVKLYLESLGIDSNRLKALSKGETEPTESNATLEGRRKNRRIEIKVN